MPLPDPRIADLQGVGKIRVALFLPLYKTNPITGDIQPTAPEGVCLVEIASALTAQLGVDLQLTGYPTPPSQVEAAWVDPEKPKFAFGGPEGVHCGKRTCTSVLWIICSCTTL